MTRHAFWVFLLVFSLPLLVNGQTNILSNGGFENWTQNGPSGPPDDWSLSSGSLTAQQTADTTHEGGYAVRLTWTSTSTVRLEQKVDVTAGYDYEFKVWVFDADSAGRARISIRWLDSSGGYIATDYSNYSTDSHSWSLLTTGTVKAPAGADTAYVQIRLYDVSSYWNGKATLYVDHAACLETEVQEVSITTVSRNHKVPPADSTLIVECTVIGGTAPYTVQLNYTVNGVQQTPVDMTHVQGEVYRASIAPLGNGTRMEYYIGVTDNAGGADTSAAYGLFWGVSPISNAAGSIKEPDENGALAYEDYYVMVRGVATVPNGVFSSYSLDIYVQDSEGGINIYKSGGGNKSIIVGNLYQIVGKLAHYKGKSEVVPDDTSEIVDLGPTTMADTLLLSLSDLLADPELYEGRLIRINQVDTVPGGGSWPDAGNNANIHVTDGTDTITLRIDRDTDIDGTPEPDWPIHLVGILGQYDGSSPYTDGYQILPRFTTDLIAIPKVDYPPNIELVRHSPKVPSANENTLVTAVVSDDNQLTLIELRYRINGGTLQTIPMTQTGGDTFTAAITAHSYTDGDRVLYRVYAQDNANQTSTSDESGFFAGTTPISMTHAADSNGVLLYSGYYARLQGVATVADSTFNKTHLDVYLQDTTAGINLFQFNMAFMDIHIGHQYRVVGKVAQYRGKTEIMPDEETDILDMGPTTPIDPQIIAIADLLDSPETYEGMLVRLQHVENTGNGDPWPLEGENANLEITDDGTSVLTLRVDKDTDIDGTPEPQWPRDVIGIFSQYDRNLPYLDSYQILPRSINDFETPTSIENAADPRLPERYHLYQNYPNPFNPRTTLRFDIPKHVGGVEVELTIVNLLGQRVNTLIKGNLKAGRYEVHWNGRSEAGKDVPGGIYFAVLKTRDYRHAIKLIYLK